MGIQQKKAKIKGVSDIVFCIDLSASMSPCIAGVKEHVITFIDSLEKGNPNMKVDWRLAFCGYTAENIYISDFTDNIELFKTSIENVDTKWDDEYTPGALDFCINHFDWREVSNKFLIAFTDETLKGGLINDDTIDNFPLLLDKINKNKIRLFFFGPKDKYYGQFESVPRAVSHYITSGFDDVDFSNLLSSLGKTVSQSIGSLQGGSSVFNTNPIFDITRIKINKL